MEISCPNCGKKYQVSDAMRGKQAHCANPDCQQAFTIDVGDSEPPPVSPPPLPPSSGTPGEPASPEEILAGYQKTSKSAGSDIGQRLKCGLDSVKKRAQAIKLRHDVKGLRTAIDGQCENLGALTLQHRPPGVDISAEMAELAQIQNEHAQKQMTLDSLTETKGSGSVVKELKREMAQLRDRQRELMIAIGAKAEAARPEMPAAAGHYSGLSSRPWRNNSVRPRKGEGWGWAR